MSEYAVSRDQLRSIVERVERLREERKAIDDDVKEVFAEAKGNGFSVPAIKHIIKVRGQDRNERAEFEAIVDVYMAALGMIDRDIPLAQVHVLAREERPDAANEWQAPREACLSEQREAYRAGKPISQDFRFENASVYFFAFPDLGRVKIGVSNDVTERLEALEKETGVTGAILHFRPGNRKVEMAMHKVFSEWHIEGEWFRDCRELRRTLSDLPDATHAQVREAAE